MALQAALCSPTIIAIPRARRNIKSHLNQIEQLSLKLILSLAHTMDNPLINGSDEQNMVDELEDYRFPSSKMRHSVNVAKQPIALIACGSFSPVI